MENNQYMKLSKKIFDKLVRLALLMPDPDFTDIRIRQFSITFLTSC
jgi:hypothetical protein